MKSSKISRRDFLKLGGLGLAGLLTPPLNFHFDDPFAAVQGRVTTRMVWMYDKPSTEATQVTFCHRDKLLNITNAVISDDVNSHNRVWYEIGKEGYVYSGNIQPVRTLLNAPQLNLPKDGILTEISVPYTDAYEAPDKTSKVAYRMYYETTHWAKAVVTAEDGQVWYQVRDDKFDKLYYARAEHMRPMNEAELAPISPDVDKKKIQVQLDEQMLVAYENDLPIFVAAVSTGGIFRVGTYTTPQGAFITYYKRPSRHMAAGDIAASGFDLPGVPWVQYITEGGISFHGTFWHNDFGRPRSHGCINLSMSTAKWLYRWSAPQVSMNKEFSFGGVGTKVEIVL
ncbi:L,D-transpeptidase [Candidatus Villigracilis affinis]|uniref:L,D-transpeptidase n=1 Tax=Candidatus Villigracilis affinis TaxID=3140682 RepID=UPI001D6B75B7|nr:L,D-transpeptidase [Anaerolineales bacterium]